MKNTEVFDKDLNPILEVATNKDLETLVEYLSEKLSEELTGHETFKNYNPKHSIYADLIAKEIRDMGGNSFANVWRGEGPSYHELVCDVADKVNAPYNKNKPVQDIENSILETILTTALDRMTDSEKEELLSDLGNEGGMSKGGIATATFIAIFKAGGFKSYILTVTIANQIAKAILGRGLALATNATIMRSAAVLTGPIGWAITGLWTAVDIAGPAYKVTIPCVIHVAMLRKKLNSLHCENCEAVLPDSTMKFCPECGKELSV